MPPTPSVSGTFLSRPEGGMEYGVDYGAPGLLGAPVTTPLAGTFLGWLTGQGWAPGRLVFDTPGGIFGIGHVNAAPGLAPGQRVAAGQLVGSVGDSSAYGGTAQSNAHIETMFAPGVHNLAGATHAAFTSGGADLVATDTALAQASLGGGPVTPSPYTTAGFPGLEKLPLVGPAFGAAETAKDAVPGIAQAIADFPGSIFRGIGDFIGAGTHNVKVWAQDQSVAFAVAVVVLLVLFGTGNGAKA